MTGEPVEEAGTIGAGAVEAESAPAAPAVVPAPAQGEGAARGEAPGHFAGASVDPRRGLLWAGAAPMDAGSGRLGVGVGGAWLATWKGLHVAGGGAELDLAWAPTRRLALSVTGAVATGGARAEGATGGALAPGATTGDLAGFFALDPASGWAGMGSARYLVVDGPRARVAPFVAGGVGALGERGAVGVVGGGLAVEVPFYDVVFDLALPLSGAVVAGELPASVPLAVGDFAPLFLLFEAGFTWRLGPYTTFRLGYVALATSYSWRYRRGPLTVELTGHTNVLTANVSGRVGWGF